MIESEPRGDAPIEVDCWRWKVSYGAQRSWKYGFRECRFSDDTVGDQARYIAVWRMRVGAL
jgi:hypothetical protein